MQWAATSISCAEGFIESRTAVFIPASALEFGVHSTRSLETLMLTRRTFMPYIVFVIVPACERSPGEMNIDRGRSIDIQGGNTRHEDWNGAWNEGLDSLLLSLTFNGKKRTRWLWWDYLYPDGNTSAA